MELKRKGAYTQGHGMAGAGWGSRKEPTQFAHLKDGETETERG